MTIIDSDDLGEKVCIDIEISCMVLLVPTQLLSPCGLLSHWAILDVP